MAATCILSCRGDVTFMMQDTVKSLSGMRARSTEYSQLPLRANPDLPKNRKELSSFSSPSKCSGRVSRLPLSSLKA